MFLLYLFCYALSLEQKEDVAIKELADQSKEIMEDEHFDNEFLSLENLDSGSQEDAEALPFIYITPRSEGEYGIQSRIISYVPSPTKTQFFKIASGKETRDTIAMILISIVGIISVVSIVVLVVSIVCLKKGKLAVNDIESDFLSS